MRCRTRRGIVSALLSGTLLVTGAAAAHAASFVPLGDLAGGSFASEAHGVSADGTVVVGESRGTNDAVTPFRWTEAGGMQGLGDLPGGNASGQALDASGDGSAVAGVGSSTSGFEAFRWTAEAFLWDTESGMRGLGDL